MASKEAVKRVYNEYGDDEDGRPKKIPRTLTEKDSEKRLIIILENASLETIKVTTSLAKPDLRHYLQLLFFCSCRWERSLSS